ATTAAGTCLCWIHMPATTPTKAAPIKLAARRPTFVGPSNRMRVATRKCSLKRVSNILSVPRKLHCFGKFTGECYFCLRCHFKVQYRVFAKGRSEGSNLLGGSRRYCRSRYRGLRRWVEPLDGIRTGCQFHSKGRACGGLIHEIFRTHVSKTV